jgi:hypothetical protein
VAGPLLSGAPGLLVRERPSGAGSSAGDAGRAIPADRKRRRLRGALRLISPVVLLLLWQGENKLGLVSTQKLPPPTEVWSTWNGWQSGSGAARRPASSWRWSPG